MKFDESKSWSSMEGEGRDVQFRASRKDVEEPRSRREALSFLRIREEQRVLRRSVLSLHGVSTLPKKSRSRGRRENVPIILKFNFANLPTPSSVTPCSPFKLSTSNLL